jgi:hypothetical protein
MGKGSCGGVKRGEMSRTAEFFASSGNAGAGPIDFDRTPRERNKNFRQPLARTLEPGTLPEIFVDADWLG